MGNQKSYIYIIGEKDKTPYKVGVSKNPKKRLKSLQTGYPRPLVLYFFKEIDADKSKLIESIIHYNVNKYKTKGEWFDIDLKTLMLEIEYAFIRYEDDPILRTIVKGKMLSRFR